MFFFNDLKAQFFLKRLQLGSLFVLCLLTATGCSTYQFKVRDAVSKIKSGEAAAAAEILKPEAERESDDQLVYLLEYAIARHQAGQLEESTRAFLKAYDMVEIKDYHSLSRITGSVLLNEGMIQYKGEDFEKVMINAYLALNFLLMDKLESAAVEARRVNEILYKLKQEANRPYDQNPMARYISAIIWEAEKNWDSMYIDYKNTHALAPQFSYLPHDLISGAKKADRPEELSKWQKEFKEIKPDLKRYAKDTSELIFIYQQGIGPKKIPHPNFPRIPKLYPRSARTVAAKIQIFKYAPAKTPAADSPTPAPTAEAAPVVSVTPDFELRPVEIFNLQEVAIKNLDDQYSELIAKRIGGVVAKAVVSDQIRQKNQVLGDIAWIAMNLADQADLRQWSLLPATFQLSRQILAPGMYKYRVIGLDSAGQPTGENSTEAVFEVKPGQKKFLTWRSFQ